MDAALASTLPDERGAAGAASAASVAPMALPDPLRDVSFCRASRRSAPSTSDDGGAPFTVFAASLILAGAALWILGRILLWATGWPTGPAFWVGLLVSALVLPVVAIVAAGLRAPARWRGVSTWADLGKRIHVCAPPARLSALGPVTDEDFEPEYFRILIVPPKGWLEGLIYAAGAVGVIPLIGQISRLLGAGPIPPFFAMQVGFLAAMVAIATLRQTYLRVVPGRLDVMRFTMWRPTADSCRTFDLRGSNLVIDPRRRRLVVSKLGDEPSVMRPATVVSFIGSATPYRLAHTLLRAAVSTAPTPNLPTDRLHE